MTTLKRTLAALLSGVATVGAKSHAPPSFTVDEILVYTGDGGQWSPGTEFGSEYIHYRFGCADGQVIATGGRDVRDLPMEVYGNGEQPFNFDFLSIFGAYLSGNYGGWHPLPVNLTERADVDVVYPASFDATHEGCSEPAFIELLYFSTNGWELSGLTVSAGGKYKTFAPDTAWPRLVAPFDDYDSVFLDLDGNFSDYYLASDPLARLWLVDTCDAVARVTTGNGGTWAPGDNQNLHYKLLFGNAGLTTSFRALAPARGPPPESVLTKKWEPAHQPLTDSLTRSVYGGLVSRSDLDFRHLDEITVDQGGVTDTWRDRVAWECPESDPTHVELIYGPTANGWEMEAFEVALQKSTVATPPMPKKGWYAAVFTTEYPKLFAKWDNSKTVFFDYNSKCVPENWGDSVGPSTFYSCESDWYMRFNLKKRSSKKSSDDDDDDSEVVTAVLVTLFVTLFVVGVLLFLFFRYSASVPVQLPASFFGARRAKSSSHYSNVLGAELMSDTSAGATPNPLA